jgi:hypothetical protein
MSFSVKPSDWILLSPEIFLTASGLLVLSLAVSFGKAKEEFLSFLSILAVAVTGCLVVFVSAQPNRATPILGGTFVVDNFALFFGTDPLSLSSRSWPRCASSAPPTQAASTTRSCCSRAWACSSWSPGTT